MLKLCPLLTSNGKSQRCVKEKCAWWIEVEDNEDGGMCAVNVIAYNTSYNDYCEHE